MQCSGGHEHGTEELGAVHQDELVAVDQFRPRRTVQCELDVGEELIVDQLQQVRFECTLEQWHVLAEHGLAQSHCD